MPITADGASGIKAMKGLVLFSRSLLVARRLRKENPG